MKTFGRIGWALFFVLALSSPAAWAQQNSEMSAGPNALQTREFFVEGHRVGAEGNGAVTQRVYCWQVAEGSWNGQRLAGLSLVLVQDAGRGTEAGTLQLYVDDAATQAQREALIAAIRASNPILFPSSGSNGVRIEPASITVEQKEGGVVLLHLGLIA